MRCSRGSSRRWCRICITANENHPLVILIGVISVLRELWNQDVDDLHVVSGVRNMRIAIHFFHQNGSGPCDYGIEDSLCSLHSTIMCTGRRRKDRDHNGTVYSQFHRMGGKTERMMPGERVVQNPIILS